VTWASRAKLFVGLILVLAVVAACTLVFNQRQTHVRSTSAQVASAQFGVGTDYGGIVEESFVREGDTVREGERLFTVRSLQLQRDIEAGNVAPSPATVDAESSLIVRATATGVVADLDQATGSFATAGSRLATIDVDGSYYAEAEFTLAPRDFGRIDDGAEVTLELPDGREFAGTVADITVKTIDGAAHVTLRVECDELASAVDDALIKPGTPLAASLALRSDGPLAGVHDAISDLARKVGL